MALETVVFPQNLFGGGAWGYGFGGGELEEMVGGGRNQGEGRGVVVGGVHGSWGLSCFSSVVQSFQEFDVNSSSTESCTTTKEAEVGPRKRQRGRRCKNKEEVENQRMTHIAVERNRRKMMNEYLAVLRSLMPPSYVQRGDQASIVAGAINFVKELEQLLQSLEAQKQVNHQSSSTKGSSSLPFAGFFSFPQYSSCSAAIAAANTSTPGAYNTSEAVAMADIEVTMAESHVNLKVLSRRRPKQLLRLVEGLHSLRLTTLHLNVTTVDEMVLYSFNLKVEDDCRLTSVDEIATAVYQMVGMIKEEAGVI